MGRENRSVAIRNGELLTTGDLERELYNLKAVKEALEGESRRLNKCCDELYESLIQAEELRRESNDSITEARADTKEDIKVILACIANKLYYLYKPVQHALRVSCRFQNERHNGEQTGNRLS
jgi:hypothetical protein